MSTIFFKLNWQDLALIKEQFDFKKSILRLTKAGNTKGGSITVPLTSCLAG